MHYKVTIKCSAPPKPEAMTDRTWLSHISRLGFVLGGDWVMGLRTLRAVIRVESDDRKIIEGYTYRHKDSTWAIEQALRCWRTELRLLLDVEEHDYTFPLTISVKVLPES